MKKIELLKQPGYIYDLFSLFVSYYNRAEANYGGGADEGRGEKRQFFPAVRRWRRLCWTAVRLRKCSHEPNKRGM